MWAWIFDLGLWDCLGGPLLFDLLIGRKRNAGGGFLAGGGLWSAASQEIDLQVAFRFRDFVVRRMLRNLVNVTLPVRVLN
jgi:hypothetical protein